MRSQVNAVMNIKFEEMKQLVSQLPWGYIIRLLCRSKKKLVVEYALRGFLRPIGVAAWETQITKALPKELRGSLPTVEKIEAELTREERT